MRANSTVSAARHVMLVWLALLLLTVQAVDKSNFRTCAQTPFCVNHRQTSASRPQHVFHVENMHVSQSDALVRFDLLSGATSLTCQLSVLDGMARIVIMDKDPPRPRYRVGHQRSSHFEAVV